MCLLKAVAKLILENMQSIQAPYYITHVQDIMNAIVVYVDCEKHVKNIPDLR